MLSDDAVQLIRDTLAPLPRGERGRAVTRLAQALGVSEATVWRKAKIGGPRRKRQPGRPEYRDWVRTATAIAHRAPKPVSLDLAIAAGLESGELPPEAAAMPVGTAYRLARELGYRRRRRHHRMYADYPMQVVQIDGSSSEHLVPVKRLEDGDWQLRLHRRPHAARGYKNKPLGPERMRVLVYAIYDLCTGFVRARYEVAQGEDALGAMRFLVWALQDHGDPRSPMHGVPDDLMTDQGPLFKSKAAVDLVSRLGIGLSVGEPYAKERMGGVERSHGTRWRRFERSLFLREQAEITLSAVNDRLWEFEARENGRRQSRTRVAGRAATRTQAWTALTNGRPADNRLRKLPEDAIETLAREDRRKVSIGGIVRWEGTEYELSGEAAARMVDRWVTVRRQLEGGDVLTVEDSDGHRAQARPLRRRAHGEMRKAPATPLEVLQATDAAAPERPGADLFGRREESGVLSMPARSDVADELENPLSVPDAYSDLDSAMRDLVALCPPLSPAQREKVAAHLEREGLSRRAVHDLAARLTRAAAGGTA